MNYSRDIDTSAAGPDGASASPQFTAFKAAYGEIAFGDAGRAASGTSCDMARSCSPMDMGASPITVTASEAGGFDIGGPNETPLRAFAFKTADGQLSMFALYPNAGGMVVLTRQQALALPEVDGRLNFWDFAVNNAGDALGLADFSMVYRAVDGASGTYSRLRPSDARLDAWTINSPMPRMRVRETDACTVGGQPLRCIGVIAMPLAGTGVTVYAGLTPSDVFGFAVGH